MLKRVGFCPTSIETLPDGRPRTCATYLLAPVGADEVVCENCGAVWPSFTWQILGGSRARQTPLPV